MRKGPLSGHGFFIAFYVHTEIFIAGHVFYNIYGQAVCIVQFEGCFALDYVPAFDFNGNERLDYADTVLLAQQARLAQSRNTGSCDGW